MTTSRTRTFGTGFQQLTGNSVVKLCNGTQTSTTYYTNIWTGESTTVKDTVTPNFRKRSAAGEVIINDFDRETTIKVGSVGSWQWTWTPSCTGTGTKSQSNSGTRGMFDASMLLPEDPDWSLDALPLRVLAGTRAMANVVPPDVQANVDLFEIRKTIRMVRRPLEGVAKLFRDIEKSKKFQAFKRKREIQARVAERRQEVRVKRAGRRGITNPNLIRKGRTLKPLAERPGVATAYADFVTSEWLKLRYGVVPLLSSIGGALDVLREPKVSPRYTARGVAKAAQRSVESTTNITSDFYFTGTLYRKTVVDREVRAGVIYQHVFTVHDRLGQTVEQIPATLWELTTLSFVVDWVLNVGDYLQAVVPKANTQILGSWTTYRARAVATGILDTTPRTLTNYSIVGSANGTQVVDYEHVARTPGVNVGLQTSEVELSLGKNRDLKRIADACALIRTLMGRKHNPG